jgi:hypothetical protein
MAGIHQSITTTNKQWLLPQQFIFPMSQPRTRMNEENKGSIHVEQPANNKQFSSGFNSNSGVNYGGGPKFNFPKIELKKFDGTKVFTWVNQIEKYFELHNIMDDKKRIHIETLNFEIKPYQWYQWIVKRKPPFIIILGVYLQET